MPESIENRNGLTVNWPEFDRLCADRGWHNDPQRATGLGLGYQTLNHIRNGRLYPDGILLRRCLVVFGADAVGRVFVKAAA